MQLPPKQTFFSEFFSQRLKCTLNFEHFDERDDPHNWDISEVTDSEKRGYINVQKVLFQRNLRKATW